MLQCISLQRLSLLLVVQPLEPREDRLAVLGEVRRRLALLPLLLELGELCRGSARTQRDAERISKSSLHSPPMVGTR
jgi:hypothetical protein